MIQEIFKSVIPKIFKFILVNIPICFQIIMKAKKKEYKFLHMNYYT